jgi:hypothetical protein
MAIPAFTLPAPTAFGETGQNPPIWANFLAIASGASGLNVIIAALNALPVPPASLFDHFATVSTSGTGITPLYSDTIAGGQLANNGDKLHAWYYGQTASGATGTRDWTISFGGSTIFDTGALGSANVENWWAEVNIIRQNATTVRCGVSMLIGKGGVTLFSQPLYTAVTATLSSPQVLAINGQTTVGAETISATMGFVQFIPA